MLQMPNVVFDSHGAAVKVTRTICLCLCGLRWNRFSPKLRSMCHCLYQVVSQRFQQSTAEAVWTVVGTVIFLRFINPAIGTINSNQSRCQPTSHCSHVCMLLHGKRLFLCLCPLPVGRARGIMFLHFSCSFVHAFVCAFILENSSLNVDTQQTKWP